MKQDSERSQSAQVLFHLDFLWINICLQQLNAPLLAMSENILIAVGARGTDLKKPRFNNLMNTEGFKFNDKSFEEGYELVHQMSDNIEVCCRVAFVLLSLRMGYVRRHIVE